MRRIEREVARDHEESEAMRRRRDAEETAHLEWEREQQFLHEEIDAGNARLTQLKDQLAHTKDPTKIVQLQQELADAQSKLDALNRQLPSRPPCNCAPGDPLCSCL
jgi:colicin import membrane protein